MKLKRNKLRRRLPIFPNSFRIFLPYIILYNHIFVFPAYDHGDQVIQQGDIVQFKGASHEIQQYRDQFHKEPFWTNSMFGGMPAYQVGTLYHGNIFQYLDKILMGGLPYPSGCSSCCLSVFIF
jgi:hypothetical protein